VAFIDKGRLLAVESPKSLGLMIAENERIDFDGPEHVAESLRTVNGVTGVTHTTVDTYRVEVRDKAATKAALQLLLDEGITSIRTSRPSLEEVYVHLIGNRGLRV
jgi:ABC-2 type transport system ATP-binding protein